MYHIIISFLLVFLSELGDKTQLLVLSFSTKAKTLTILLGVGLGSLFSHGIAIVFGSFLGNTGSLLLHQILEFITYSSFILIGLIGLLPKKEEKQSSKSGITQKVSSLKLNYIFLIALTIAVGEIGDKTFLSSIGLGIQYPSAKFLLIIGAILGMIASDLIAIVTGKLLSKKIPTKSVEILSSILFLLFGFIGLFNFLFNC